MLRWQQSVLLQKRALQYKIIGYTTAIHIIVLCFLLFFYNDNLKEASLKFTVTPERDIPIVFVPHARSGALFQKEEPKPGALLQQLPAVSSSTATSSKAVAPKKTAKQVFKPKAKTVKKQATLTKEKQQKQKIAQSSKAILNTQKDKKREQNQIKQKVTKKEQKQKIAQPIVKEPIAEKKELIEEQKIKETQKTESVSVPILPEGSKVLNVPVVVGAGEAAVPVYVGAQELPLLRMQEGIQRAIEEQWRVPAGLSKNLLCEVKVVISAEGKAKAVLHKSSGVLVYDVAAESAAQRANYSKELWGKEITITFNNR